VTTLKTKGEERSVTGPSQLEFATVYRENFGRLAAFFARRCRDPQQVADLTSQTFVEAISSAHTYRGRGTPAAWLIAIARRVYAQHLASETAGVGVIDQLGGQLILADDEVEEPVAWEQWRAQTHEQRSRGLKFIAVVCAVAVPGSVVVGIAPFGANDSLVWTILIYVVLLLVWVLEVAFVEARRASRRVREARAAPTAASASHRR
jgi:DNA-directed RNA polymerase specialized sigma24 family protein